MTIPIVFRCRRLVMMSSSHLIEASFLDLQNGWYVATNQPANVSGEAGFRSHGSTLRTTTGTEEPFRILFCPFGFRLMLLSIFSPLSSTMINVFDDCIFGLNDRNFLERSLPEARIEPHSEDPLRNFKALGLTHRTNVQKESLVTLPTLTACHHDLSFAVLQSALQLRQRPSFSFLLLFA